MTQNPGARLHGPQPPLPLVDPDGASTDPPAAGADAEWRLDEHTREVGRRGIAAARAALRSSHGPTGRGGTGRSAPCGAPDHAPGRAA